MSETPGWKTFFFLILSDEKDNYCPLRLNQVLYVYIQSETLLFVPHSM